MAHLHAHDCCCRGTYLKYKKKQQQQIQRPIYVYIYTLDPEEIQMLETLRFGSSSVTVAGVAFCDRKVAAAAATAAAAADGPFPFEAWEADAHPPHPFLFTFLMCVCCYPILTRDVCCSNTDRREPFGKECVRFGSTSSAVHILNLQKKKKKKTDDDRISKEKTKRKRRRRRETIKLRDVTFLCLSFTAMKAIPTDIFHESPDERDSGGYICVCVCVYVYMYYIIRDCCIFPFCTHIDVLHSFQFLSDSLPNLGNLLR
jgi:hypothetical protein